MKLKQSEIKNLIKQALDKYNDMYETMKENNNHQAQYVKGVKDTLSDVLAAMEGNTAYLRILAEKRY